MFVGSFPFTNSLSDSLQESVFILSTRGCSAYVRTMLMHTVLVEFDD